MSATNTAHSHLMKAKGECSDAFAAMDTAIGAGLPSHAHSCALMVRGELGHMIRRIGYVAMLAGVPDRANETVGRIHGNAGAGEGR
jgi:hypothetical protein